MDEHLITNNFVSELTRSVQGKKTSLPFLVHTLPQKPLVSNNSSFQVIAIGGTNFTSATVKKTANGVQILSQTEGRVPTFSTKNVFFSYIETLFQIEQNVLVLNFAFPLTPLHTTSSLDGILLHGTKEHTFEGLVGKAVGKELSSFLENKLKKSVQINVVNDTIGLLFAGLKNEKNKNALACGIVGTGVNFGFFLSDYQCVNLESANFDKFQRSETGAEIDNISQMPGKALFEKEVSGAYLFQHFNKILEKKKESFTPLSSTEELDNIAQNTSSHSILAKKILHHSAMLVACQIAGIVKFKQSNMTFVMEGGLFWNATDYKKTIEQTLIHLLPSYTVRFISVKNSSIIGAGLLVC